MNLIAMFRGFASSDTQTHRPTTKPSNGNHIPLQESIRRTSFLLILNGHTNAKLMLTLHVIQITGKENTKTGGHAFFQNSADTSTGIHHSAITCLSKLPLSTKGTHGLASFQPTWPLICSVLFPM